jgi:F0F1-type ATP synthase assembly protein I
MNKAAIVVAILAAIVVGAVLGYFVVNSVGITNTSETARTKAR